MDARDFWLVIGGSVAFVLVMIAVVLRARRPAAVKLGGLRPTGLPTWTGGKRAARMPPPLQSDAVSTNYLDFGGPAGDSYLELSTPFQRKGLDPVSFTYAEDREYFSQYGAPGLVGAPEAAHARANRGDDWWEPDATHYHPGARADVEEPNPMEPSFLTAQSVLLNHARDTGFDGSAVDPATGHKYFFNSETGEREWA